MFRNLIKGVGEANLEYNLKSNKYNQILLNKLNLTFNKEKYNMYIKKIIDRI